MKKQLTVYSLSALLLGCAGSYKRPESIESKMARYKSKSAEINKVPDMQVLANVEYNKSKRGPASVKSRRKDLFTEHTNKKLYFLTLLTQYSKLSEFSKSESIPSVNICPSFHSILVDHKDKFEAEGVKRTKKKKISFSTLYTKETFTNPARMSYFPELMLPVSKEDTHPTVAEYLGSNSEANAEEVLSSAINLHLNKTYDELVELCDSGTSNNYYIYENLITHIKKQGMRPSATNMKILLKTSIFTNIALIKSFEKSSYANRGRSLASVGERKEAYSEAVIKRLGVDWSETYFDSMTSNR